MFLWTRESESISCSAVSASLRPRDCSPPGSSLHGILQARKLEWVAIPFSRWSSPPRDWTQISCTWSRFFTIWATKEAPGQVKIYRSQSSARGSLLFSCGQHVLGHCPVPLSSEPLLHSVLPRGRCQCGLLCMPVWERKNPPQAPLKALLHLVIFSFSQLSFRNTANSDPVDPAYLFLHIIYFIPFLPTRNLKFFW